MGPEVPWPNGARGARWGGSGPRKKNPFTNRAGFGSRVQTRGSGPDMEKPGPNPTRCHSYFLVFLLSVHHRVLLAQLFL